MLNLVAFRDKKSGVLSNHFITAEPFEKIKQNISISLLQLSQREPTNPFVLFANDYDLVLVEGSIDDSLTDAELHEFVSDEDIVNCSILLDASRKAFEATHNHTSQDDELENKLE